MHTLQTDRIAKTSRVGAVVLAAGASRRMGTCKALLPLGGMPLIARMVESVLCAGAGEIDPILVVTGHEPHRIAEVLSEYPVAFAHNDDHVTGGMLSSVQTGAAALAQHFGDTDAFFLILGDQPMVRPDTLDTLLDAWRIARPRVVLPTFNGTHGHPILLDARGIDEILALPRHGGATLKTYTAQHARDTIDVPVSDPAVLEDIDTPADYQRLLERWQRRATNDVEHSWSFPPCPTAAAATTSPLAR